MKFYWKNCLLIFDNYFETRECFEMKSQLCVKLKIFFFQIEKQKRLERIKHKTQQLQELILQVINI